jgi:hypothetical protein
VSGAPLAMTLLRGSLREGLRRLRDMRREVTRSELHPTNVVLMRLWWQQSVPPRIYAALAIHLHSTLDNTPSACIICTRTTRCLS